MGDMGHVKKPLSGWIVVGIFGLATICLCLICLAVMLFSVSRLSGLSEPTRQPSPLVVTPTYDTLQVLSSIEVPISDPIALAERFKGLEDIPWVLAEQAEPIPIGTRDSFWVTNVDQNITNLVEAVLVYSTEHVYFWAGVDVVYKIEDVQRVVDNFEYVTYPTVREIIGHEWSPGVDGDPHLYILYVRDLGPSVAGLFFSRDQYSPLVHEHSNGHEMFYISADNVSLASDYVNSVLAHEFQHMIHWQLDRNEETWMNEGFSKLVEQLLGYEIGGFDYLYSRNTDRPLTRWPSEPGYAGEHYGQAFLFMTYLYDRLGGDCVRALVAHPQNGLKAIDEVLLDCEVSHSESGEMLTADDLVLDWAISLALQNPGIGEGYYGMRSYANAPIAQFSESYARCPLAEQTAQVHQYGVDLIQFTCQGDYLITFSGDLQTAILPTEPHSGYFAFWSNRGDEANMTLTKNFDLREASAPILFEYWTWYRIEEGYDYLYLMASRDGGLTWEILTTPSGTGEDPSGNSYGWAYNGISGKGSQPNWILEEVDLSRFAGEQIELRFEYVTDSAVHGEGFLLDDLSITAIGYAEDFELNDGGWVAEGFVRIKNEIPQTYRIAMIERGKDLQAREIVLDERNQAQARLYLGDEINEIILVVIGTSRYSWLPANYRFQVSSP